MKTYTIYEVVTKVFVWKVKADSPQEAEDKLEKNGFIENNDIIRCLEEDNEIDRNAEWDEFEPED
jgi:hypothetical protein